MAIVAPAQTFTTLFSFDGTDGASPEYMSLIQATDGNFYGTTVSRGAHYQGTVFKITPAGKLTTLHSFCSQPNCTDGDLASGVVQATNGNFYGTTNRGGADVNCDVQGCGTVFEITAEGKLTTLYSFNGTDGNAPNAGLVLAANGDLYGTTAFTVFEITPGGDLTTIFKFDGSDGSLPLAPLMQASNGNFYGTTKEGGADSGGTVFEITPGGKLTTLYNFCTPLFSCPHGYAPFAGLVQAANGNFYGTTAGGGANGDDGTVFEITAGGKLTTLHSFCSQSDCADGADPSAGLVLGTDGNFYGTTEIGGGAAGGGTVFKITPKGELTTLYTFCSRPKCTDGEAPAGGLMQATNGTFYGTTPVGGAHNDGTIFSLSLGLGPFVETRPTSGSVGADVVILGNNLKDAIEVNFNGTAAAFTVVQDSEIETTVPRGAITGKVEVTTSSSKLTSNVDFQVTKAISSTAVVSSLNPSKFGTAVTFTATVSSKEGTPTGTVTLKDGGSKLGTGTLSDSKVTFKASDLTKGTHSITAVYGGNDDFNGSTSPVLKQVVN